MSNTVQVPSDRDPSVMYEVDLQNWTCTCPHFQHRLREANLADGGNRSCKHLDRAQYERLGGGR